MASAPPPLEATDANLKQLSVTLQQTLNPETVHQATSTLEKLSKRAGYSILLLRLSTLDKISPNQRQIAAITLKNFIKANWDREANIHANDRQKIRQLLPDLIVTSHELVSPVLGASLTIIASFDFPERWSDLLPRLVEKLKTQDFFVLNGVLDTLLSIFNRYANVQKSHEDIMKELIFVLKHFQAPLFEIFCGTTNKLLANSSDEGVLRSHFRALLTLSRIYYYLIFVDLPEYFEDNAGRIFESFTKLLSFQSKVPFLLENEDDEDKPTVLYELQGSICNIINVWIEKYDEEFKPFLSRFAELVWNLLMKYDTRSRFDPIVTSALQFLTTTAKSIHYGVFSVGDILKNVCNKIICPHIMFRKIDQETFVENPFEYVRSDFEGSDAETRRRASSDFIRGLRKNYESQITGFFANHINRLLADYKTDPAKNWRQKDAAIYLMMGLAISSQTEQSGVEEVNSGVPILNFFKTEIQPELVSKKGHPVIQADSIKFVVQFRNQMPAELIRPIFTHCAQYLSSPNVVVHSYAAIAVDRLLAARTKDGDLRVPKEAVQPLIGPILGAIFKQLKTKESNENHYLMRALFRLCRTCGKDMMPQIPAILEELKGKLFAIAKNPSNPLFHHFLFETIASLITSICGADPSKVTSFESSLLMPFQEILQREYDDFLPYVFQILSQMLTIGSSLRDPYKKIFRNFLMPSLYASNGNVPPLISLIRGYIKQDPPFVLPHIESVLGVFQKLISSRSLDHEGFYLMESIIEFMPPRVLDPYIGSILSILFQRLRSSKTPKFVRCMVIFVSLMVGKQGGDFVIKHIDTVSADLTKIFIEKFWIPIIQTVAGKIERKVCIIGMTKLLTETPSFLQKYYPLWDKLLLATLKLLALPEEKSNNFVDADYEAEENAGYSAEFVALQSVLPQQIDPFPAENPQKYLAVNLSKLVSAHPGKFNSIKSLPPEPAEFLSKSLQAAGVSLSF